MTDKYVKSKCFILSADGYEEITYRELCHRKNTDETYQDKKFLPLHGMLMEVTPEQYTEFYKDKRRQKYLKERSLENKDFSFDALTTDTFNGANILIDQSEPIDEQVIHKIMMDKLYACLQLLTEDERLLIKALFNDGLTERQIAQMQEVSQAALHKRKVKVLEKLKEMMKI